MLTFYVVVRHINSGNFSTLHYKTNNEILTEKDLMEIEDVHACKKNGMREVKTQIISWQRLNV